MKFQENKAQKENFRIGKIRGPAWFRPLGVLIDTANLHFLGGSFGGRIRMRRILGACIFDFSSTICVSSLFVVGNRVVSDAYKMRAFLCDTRTWGRGSAPLERRGTAPIGSPGIKRLW